MKKLLVCFAFVAAVFDSHAQFSRYIVQFKDKATNPFSLSTPSQYLSQRAIDRRTRYGIAVDSTDLPVTPRYIDSLRLSGSVTVLNISRWLNQVSIQTADAAALAKMASFPFVQVVAPIAARTGGVSGSGQKEAAGSNSVPLLTPLRVQRTSADFYDYGQSFKQVHIHNGEFLHNIGLRGQNMVIGMLDGGFKNYTSLKAFDSVNTSGQVLGTYDFVARETSVVEDDAHGMQCFSIIAANIPGQFVGTAPKASFYLFRSEDGASEYPVEEHNWVCAAERVDSVGGDLISSSLGYSDQMSNPVFNHTYSEMNGNTTIAARGADLAAKKGILVANAAGNDGNGSFHYISSPADGDSVMAVGAVTADSIPAGFSSYGPSSDNQVKPDVASVGVSTVLQTQFNTIGASNGTSFACPNIAGLAASLWQGFPEVNNMRIINVLRQSGNRVASPDNRVGYGIPDVKKAVLILLKELATSSIASSPCKNTLSWTSKDVTGMRYEIERKAAAENTFIKIGDQQGTGSSFSSRSYQFSDSILNVQAGTITYRIRQIIDTAATSFAADYLDTLTVSLGSSCITTAINPVLGAGEEIILMPNPARANVTVRITTPYPVQNLIFRVSNNKGQIVATERRTKASGVSNFILPSHQWASGKYYFSIYNNEKLMATKELIKL